MTRLVYAACPGRHLLSCLKLLRLQVPSPPCHFLVIKVKANVLVGYRVVLELGPSRSLQILLHPKIQVVRKFSGVDAKPKGQFEEAGRRDTEKSD